MTTLNDALSDYYEVKLSHLAASTRKQHEATLERWRTWVVRETQPNVYLPDIDDRMMVRYFNRLLPPGHEPRTYNNYRQILKKFWDFCRGEAWVRTNPMRHVDPLRVSARVRLLLSPDELLRILDISEPRDRIALAVGMNTALRAGDISKLTIGSVNLGNDTIQVSIQKTGAEEILPMTSELRTELLKWFTTYATVMGMPVSALPNNWTLIPPIQSVAVNVHDTALGRREVFEPHRQLTHMERIVQGALRKLGHPTRGEGFHTIRRSMLRSMHDLAVADGESDAIRMVQAMAGHKNQQTTEIYLGITHEKRRRDAMMQGKSFLTRAVGAQEERREDVEGSSGIRRAV